MKVGELKAELKGRGRSGEGLRKELQKELSGILGRTTRIPALLHPGDVSVEELNLQRYEVLFFEALHCALQELPHHITDIDSLI